MSPYNNTIWVVGKKDTDLSAAPNNQLVIDFRKFNSKIIADKYSIRMILSNFGKARYFTALDLKSAPSNCVGRT